MSSMKNSTRNLLIGLGTTVAVGAFILSSSDKTMAKLEACINRKKAKMFVKDKLKGNEKALDVVEKLSDDEITNLLKVVDKVTDLKGQVGTYSNHLKDATSEFKDMLMDKKDMLADKKDMVVDKTEDVAGDIKNKIKK